MDYKNKKYKVLLSGGGTGGSVAPLLAVVEELNNPPNPLYQGGQNTPLPKGGAGGFEFLWLGTKYGPERGMVEGVEIKFKAIAGGKWRRYFSLKNLADIAKIKIGFWQSLWVMLKWRPNLIMSAGSFISVPVVWAAWFLRVPVLIHQQDALPGLANKLMAPFAKVVTVTFEKSLADYGKKAVWIGNPTRSQLKIKNYELRIFNLKINKDLPVLLVLGGGTGAEAINDLVWQSLGELTKFCQIIHITGRNKGMLNNRSKINNYIGYDFLNVDQMAEALNLSEAVVTRAGMGVLTELSFLNKPAIIIPMPASHQAANAEMFKEAAIVLEQKNLTAEKFIKEIKNLIENKELRKSLGEKMGRVMKRGANEAMVKIILGLLK